MFFKISLVTAILTVTGLVAATPLLVERQATTITPPDRYYLQTKVVGNNTDCGTDKDGLYVYSYHTGAGLGDVGLSSNVSWAWEGYLNGSQQLFTYPNAFAPWPLNVLYGPYQGWFVTTISVSAQPSADSPGYFFNASGLQYNYTESLGWIACDWWHGKPQLFSLASYFYGPLASSCSVVELHPISI